MRRQNARVLWRCAFPIVGAVVLALGFGGCAGHDTPLPLPWSAVVPNPYSWPTATPQSQGLDAAMLEQAAALARDRPYTLSLLVIRNGFLVSENYFNGATMNAAFHIHSASKSFTAALFGVALGRRLIGSLDGRLLDWFPEYADASLDPRKYSITLRHLLTMRAGFAWEEDDAHWAAYDSSADWCRYAIQLPLTWNPGETFHYCTPETNLLAAVIAKACGTDLRSFAESSLFAPLGITVGHWYQDPQGYYTGGHEMYFVPRDLARLGDLYLHDGVIGGQRVLPEGWVAESLRRTADSDWDWTPLQEPGYGYQWWLGRLASREVFFASGKGGQLVLCVPSLQMIVVTTNNGESWQTEWQQIQETLALLARYVLPAARTT